MPAISPLFNRPHWRTAVLVCVALNMLDGFDVLVLSLVSPAIAAEWHLSGQQLGQLFSAGIAGMVLGSVGLAPVADRHGRRHIVLLGMVLVAASMGLSALARSYWELAACRVITGLGIGGILACAMVLVSEYAPAERKTQASFLYTAGYSLGATLGGALATWVVQHWGWRVAFEGGALGSVLLLPLAFVFLPESESYQRAAAPASHLPIRSRMISVGPAALLRQRPGMTLLLWLAFFFAYAGYYFVFSWTPKLLVAGGLSARAGMNAGVLLSLGGLAGTLLFAFFGAKAALRWLLLFCLVSSALTMGAFPTIAQGTSIGLAAIVILGATTTSAMASFYALTPRLYAPLARSAGMGWAVGMGRIGAIAAPFIAGILVDAGWRTSALFWLFGLSLALAAAVTLLLTRDGPRDFATLHSGLHER